VCHVRTCNVRKFAIVTGAAMNVSEAHSVQRMCIYGCYCCAAVELVCSRCIWCCTKCSHCSSGCVFTAVNAVAAIELVFLKRIEYDRTLINISRSERSQQLCSYVMHVNENCMIHAADVQMWEGVIHQQSPPCPMPFCLVPCWPLHNYYPLLPVGNRH